MKLAALLFLLLPACLLADDDGFVPLFDGKTLDGWVNVNCKPTTWSVVDGMIHCDGQPTGALRTPRQYENFILELEWRHLKPAGNAGIFIWASPQAAPGVPFLRSIEVQVLDHGYTEQYERDHKKKADWFTTNGDVFPTGSARMKPFPPVAPNSERSFPRKNLSKGLNEWNHYYIRAINGEVRLWVNGEEVSGGTECKPAFGYLCLESEGSPVEFRNLRLRPLP